MHDLYKTGAGIKLKAPIFNSTQNRPKDPSPEEIRRGVFPDENAWMWDAYIELQEKVTASVAPAIACCRRCSSTRMNWDCCQTSSSSLIRTPSSKS